MSDRPVPEPDAESAPFWEATASGRLALARCGRCQSLVHPPESVCPSCLDTAPSYAFSPVSGAGAVCSWTVVRQSFLPGFEVPFVLVDVELDDAPDVRLIGRLVDGPDGAVALGARVHVVFDDVRGTNVPAFELDGAR